jgi:hypothetical protein
MTRLVAALSRGTGVRRAATQSQRKAGRWGKRRGRWWEKKEGEREWARWSFSSLFVGQITKILRGI